MYIDSSRGFYIYAMENDSNRRRNDCDGRLIINRVWQQNELIKQQ